MFSLFHLTDLILLLPFLSLTTASPLLATTTTTSPTAKPPHTTCSYTERSPLPTARHCDVQGRLLKNNNPFATHPGNSNAACLTHCLTAANSTCQSFAHDKTSKQCELYNVTVAESGGFQAGMSNIWFWDRACFEETCSRVNKSTATTTSVSSSSITLAPTSPTTPAPNATTTSAANTTSSISLPVTTITHGSSKCTIPLPLSLYDCKTISMPLSGYTALYTLYFNGTGVTESPNNPGNTPSISSLLPSYTTTLKGADTGCDAATQCVAHATGMGLGAVYMSLDLHYDLRDCRWKCVLYGGANGNASFFDVVDGRAYRTHGFSARMIKG